MKRALLAWAVAVMAIWVTSAPAYPAAPRNEGWWTATNPGGLPAPAPAPPDVPAGGLLIQAGGGGAPTAFGAVLYELDPGTSAETLTLTIAPNSLTTPSATLQLCHLLQPINHPEQGGPMSDAPPYDCSQQVTAAPSADGTGYQFAVSGLISDQLLAVAILPTGPADRVVLSAPDTNSLATAQALVPAPPPPDAGAPVAASGAAPASPAEGLSASPSLTLSPSAESVLPAPPVAPLAAAAPAPAGPGNAVATFVPAVSGRSAGATPLLVVLFVAAALGGVALWLYAGRQGEGFALSGPRPG